MRLEASLLQAGLRRRVRAAFGMVAVAALSVLLMAPASAQFWPFGGAQQRPPARVPQQQQRQQQQPQQYNPFGNWFSPSAPTQQQQQQQQQQVDHSRPPAPVRKAAETAAAAPNRIVVMGDAMADWLASGLEDAFAEKPEFGILRRARTVSGLIRPDPRREIEFAQLVRETVAADKPRFIVLMVGFHDRQTIRERPAQPAAPAKPGPQAAPEDPEGSDPDSPESRARASAEAQNAELRKAEQKKAAQAEAQKAPVNTGPMEFHTEQWEAAYVKRIDATVAALRSAGVPVFWVGLPPQRDPRRSAEATYLNELYRARAERAGIVFVDIWDGFVDEGGRYALQGADFEGQIRRLRSGDGIYFTKAGARKLAHYVEREIQRGIVSTAIPVALPTPEPAAPATPGRSGPRPLAGPVVPLTAPFGMGKELLGGGTTKPLPNDPTATRVLVRGEAIAPVSGRADNFTWPRGSEPPPAAAAATPPETATATAPATEPEPAQKAAPAKAAPKSPRAVNPNPNPNPPAENRPPPRPRAQTSGSGPPRPPLEITPYFGR